LRPRVSMLAVSRKTYAIEGNGPYDEDEVRDKIRRYCDEHGLHAALTLKIFELVEGGKKERRIDPGLFLDAR
jgi:hypothetical protein